MDYLISLTLVLLSGLFSGLTLGLMSLDTHTLRRRAKHGNTDAVLVYPVRKRGNQLLTTLLLGNVLVNTTLSIYLGSIAPGVVAGLIATSLIVLFGEILPQAVISRHGLWFGARTIWITKFFMLLFSPVAWPIARLLDKALGSELPTTYSHHELMDIISEHEDSEHSAIDEDEERIVHGALRFSHRQVRDVMTPEEQVVMVDVNRRLTDEFFNEMAEHGHSRVPVYAGDRENIVGILFAKDLLVEEEGIGIADTKEAFDTDILEVRGSTKLDTVLGQMLKRRLHLAIVKSRAGKFLGVITLEDIIEEIIQTEIEDEDDE